ncbi:MAG: hypothetical protein LBG11_11445 [Bifidobacteriaceae bacterium]|jgi:hypothetical protein|nr:hypothetical protein [Bifidobacteriaceae bacterium]
MKLTSINGVVDESNHPAFVNTITLAPGEPTSIARFVVTGLSEVREPKDRKSKW